MSNNEDIPVLTDLIESGPEVTLFDLGLEKDPVIGADRPTQIDDTAIDIDDAAPFSFADDDAAEIEVPTAGFGANPPDLSDIDPALEQAIRRIFDEHMELAWQEMRLAIQQHLKRP